MNADLGDSLKIYLSINGSSGNLLYLGTNLTYNGATGVYTYQNADSGVTDEPYVYTFNVVSNAGILRSDTIS